MSVSLVLLLVFLLHQLRQRFFIAFITLCHKFHLPTHIAVWVYALLFLPGTILHELSHFITAAILGLRTGEIQLLPEIQPRGIKFGSVAIEKKDIIRSFLVGMAPTVFGFAVIITLFTLNTSLPDTPLYLFLYFYLTLTIASHTFPSPEDMTYAVPFFLLFSFVIGIWWYLDVTSLYSAVQLIDKAATVILKPLGAGTLLAAVSWALLTLINRINVYTQ